MGHDQQPDYYEILGVDRTASPEEITRAFRKSMRAVHPDASGTTGLFRLVKTAYDTLGDPASRAAYDARHVTSPHRPPKPPAPPPPRPAPEPDRASRPGPKQAGREAPGREQTWATAETAAGPREVDAPAVRVRPRFGAHWTPVALVAAWTAAFLVALYLLWPPDCPRALYVMLVLPVVAGPILFSQPALRSRMWPWSVCIVLFMGAAALAAATGEGSLWPFRGVLAGVALGAVGLAATPVLVWRGRNLDQLVSRDSLEYQIFNVPGAGLTLNGAREVSQISAGHLERLADLDGVRILHGLTPPPRPGQAGCYVDHVVLRGNRLALVVARRWPAVTYTWADGGVLTANGHRFPHGDTGIARAVESFRKITPRGVQVRGFVAVLPEDGPPAMPPGLVPAGRGDLFAGSLPQVSEQAAAWLGGAGPVVYRRVLAGLLPYIHRSDTMQ